jgi:sugar phosphate isomerase/epimerase
MTGDIGSEFELMKNRIRSTHLHDNNGREDQHLFPKNGTIDWQNAMRLLGSCPEQYPMLLELREPPDAERPIEEARRSIDEIAKYLTDHEQ